MSNYINENIASFRKSKGLTQEEFGKILNLQRSTYAYKENSGFFTAADIALICERFELSGDYFEKQRTSINLEDSSYDSGVQIFRSPEISFERSEDEEPTLITYKESQLLKQFRALGGEKQNEIFEFLKQLNEDK